MDSCADAFKLAPGLSEFGLCNSVVNTKAQPFSGSDDDEGHSPRFGNSGLASLHSK
jgi:hypothetical protein